MTAAPGSPRWTIIRLASIVAAAVAIAAAFMPWLKAEVVILSISVRTFSINGMDREGQ